MKKNKVIQSIAMGILSFSLLSNNFMAYATEEVPQQEEDINNENEETNNSQNQENENNTTIEEPSNEENINQEESLNKEENNNNDNNDGEDNTINNDNKEDSSSNNEENNTLSEPSNDQNENNSNDNKELNENSNTQTIENEVIEYHEEIADIPTEEEKDKIIEEKTEEQEEMKQDIIDQGGTYDYAITVETITLEKEVSEEVDSEEEAKELADEVDGTIETEVINSTEGSTTTIVETEEEVENVVEEIAAAAPDNVEREITNVETEEVSGVSAEQTDEKGYHIDENDDGSFTIVVTGGLDEIEIDFAWFSSIQLMYPGDEINASFTIVNESGDKYEVTGYEKKSDGPYRYSLTSNFNEEWGTPVTTFTDGRGRECTAYIPNEILKINGRNIDRSTLEIMYKEYPDKDMWERREIAKNLTEEDLLNYYNEQMGTDYETAFEAWYANLNERLWTTTYTKDGEEAAYGEDFWTSVDLTTNTPVDFTMTASLDGLGTDNLYQMTVWEFVELLKLKAVPNIEVTVDYIDNELKYIVNYTVEETNYAVEIDGKGSIPKKIEPDPEPIPQPEPKPIPEPEQPTIDPKPEQPEQPTIDPKPEPIIPDPIDPIPIPIPIKPEEPEETPTEPTIIPINDNDDHHHDNNDEPSETITIEEDIPLIDEPKAEKKEAPRVEKIIQSIKQMPKARMAETGDKHSIQERYIIIIGCLILIVFLIIVDIDRKRKS